MHRSFGLVALLVAATAADASFACTPNNPGKLQSGRTVIIDAKGGVAHGSVNHGETQLLRDKEVILTFDDGPIAGRTPAVLEALEHHCVKATFFPVGRMAMTRPEILRDTVRRGHTIGAHTWSHPNLPRVGLARSRGEIQMGFAAVEAVIGPRVAPVFRFPYLAQSQSILSYVKSKDIASISIDVDSGDTRGYGVSRVVGYTMEQLRKRGRGILLFHDSKLVTVKALPQILDLLAKESFRVVRLKTTSPYRADPDLVARYRRRLGSNAAAVAEPPAKPGEKPTATEPAGDAVASQQPDAAPKPEETTTRSPAWNPDRAFVTEQ